MKVIKKIFLKSMNTEFEFIKVVAESEAVSLSKTISETHKDRPGLEKEDKIKHKVKFASTDIRLKSRQQPKKKKEVYIFSQYT